MPRKVIIVGGGPAGYTAALYLARARLEPLCIEGLEYGGQLMGTTEVENYPGFPEGIMGPELMDRFRKQAERFGAEYLSRNVTKVAFDRDGGPHRVFVEDEVHEAHAVVVSTGAGPRKLGLESEKRLWGRGVSSCATCDGAFYRDRVVAVVGGGDSACEEANFLTRFASRVHLLHRRDQLRASKIMQERTLKNPKIQPEWNTVPVEVLGDKSVTGVRLEDTKSGARRDLAIDGFFLAIGHVPNTELFADQLKTDAQGYLVPEHGVTMDIPGVFACGDCVDHHYRQAITASAMGCMAAIDTERWLEARGL